MKPLNWRPHSLLASTCFLLMTVTHGLLTQTAHAQFTSPPDQGAPKGTAGGGSRPSNPSVCLTHPDRQEALLAMAPTQFVGLTSAANPTVWIYVPPTTAKTLEFSLFTQEKDGVYQTNLPVNASGLLPVTLPSKIALTTAKPYYWTAALVCNPKRRTEDWVVGSWIQQRSLTAELRHQLAQASVEQRVNLYTQSGFWYEALNTYLELRQTQPANPNHTALWAKLLSAAGLSTIAPQGELIAPQGELIAPQGELIAPQGELPRLAPSSLATQASR